MSFESASDRAEVCELGNKNLMVWSQTVTKWAYVTSVAAPLLCLRQEARAYTPCCCQIRIANRQWLSCIVGYLGSRHWQERRMRGIKNDDVWSAQLPEENVVNWCFCKPQIRVSEYLIGIPTKCAISQWPLFETVFTVVSLKPLNNWKENAGTFKAGVFDRSWNISSRVFGDQSGYFQPNMTFTSP